jgi:Tol biopolymer transport system component
MLVLMGTWMANAATTQSALQALIFSNFTCDTMTTMGGCYNNSVDLSEIYRINADGSGMTKLTAQPIEGFIYALAASPDGTQIAFLLNPGQSSRSVMVYTMNSDGTDLQAILPDSSGRRYTSILWSPDGSQLLLQDENSTRERQSLMSASGSSPQVIRAFQVGLKISVTEWAADGRFFAYDHMGGVLWVNPDGTDRTPLPTIETTYYEPHPVPSRNLTHLAFFSQVDEPQFGTDALVITDANGETEQTFTDIVQNDTGNLDVFPTLRWSPDDDLIAYIGQGETGNYSLMVIGADGSNRMQLTTTPLQVFAFDWIPAVSDSAP